jgi:hypothetical protein
MLLISLLLTLCFGAIQEKLSMAHINSDGQVKEEISKHFSDKFYCFLDKNGMYKDWTKAIYGNNQWDDANGVWFCCGYMANGRKQCDRLTEWRVVNGNSFTLCEETYQAAISTKDGNKEKPRRDLCCSNNHFDDCSTCKSFVVWDFTVDTNSHGGDKVLEASYNCNKDSTADIPEGCDDYEIDGIAVDGKVTLKDTWRDVYYSQKDKSIETDPDTTYPPYAYGNEVYPAGFAHATLREFNDPPVCVYAPNVGGRVLEIRVEPDEAGSQLCVDDLLADTAEKNNPGVTQACDDVRLQTCFPDANSDAVDAGGFAFVISCSESCADSDVDLWFRLRASVNKWTEAGEENKGTDKTEVNTEMWCMWGNQNMVGELPTLVQKDRNGNVIEDENGEPVVEIVETFKGLDGDFSKWDVYPSDLEPETDPQVRPVESNVSCFSLAILISALALLF